MAEYQVALPWPARPALRARSGASYRRPSCENIFGNPKLVNSNFVHLQKLIASVAVIYLCNTEFGNLSFSITEHHIALLYQNHKWRYFFCRDRLATSSTSMSGGFSLLRAAFEI